MLTALDIQQEPSVVYTLAFTNCQVHEAVLVIMLVIAACDLGALSCARQATLSEATCAPSLMRSTHGSSLIESHAAHPPSLMQPTL